MSGVNFRRTRVREIHDEVFITGEADINQLTERVAIIAAYFSGSTLRPRDRRFIEALAKNGYKVIFTQANPNGATQLRWGNETQPPGVVLLSRGNYGYDFGSWSIALKYFPQLVKLKFVVFSNDSIIGPFSDLEPTLRAFENSNCDVWGATMNNQVFPHIQSYFMGFRNGILGDRVLRQFWNGIRIEQTKEEIVANYELGLTRLLFSEAYVFDTSMPSRILVDYDLNPTLQAWQRIMELGFPFIKKMVLEQPDLAWNASAAAGFIKTKYDQEISEWL